MGRKDFWSSDSSKESKLVTASSFHLRKYCNDGYLMCGLGMKILKCDYIQWINLFVKYIL